MPTTSLEKSYLTIQAALVVMMLAITTVNSCALSKLSMSIDKAIVIPQQYTIIPPPKIPEPSQEPEKPEFPPPPDSTPLKPGDLDSKKGDSLD